MREKSRTEKKSKSQDEQSVVNVAKRYQIVPFLSNGAPRVAFKPEHNRLGLLSIVMILNSTVSAGEGGTPRNLSKRTQKKNTSEIQASPVDLQNSNITPY